MATKTADLVIGEPAFTKGPGPQPRRIKVTAVVTSKSTTQYSIGDVLGDLIKVPLAEMKVRAGIVHLTRCTTDKAVGAVPIQLNYYNDVITAIDDNSAFTLSYTENLNRIGSNQFNLGNSFITSGSMGFASAIDIDFVLAKDKDLYIQPVCGGTPTPNLNQQWAIELIICCW